MSANDLSVHPPAVSEQTPMEALVLYCISTQKLESHNAMLYVRWLFMLLTVGDMGIKMFGRDSINSIAEFS